MALDEALREQVSEGKSPPTLRLYYWSPPCLSLGYAQSFKDIDLDRLQERGWDFVRRPTGGKAILHCDELTYSITAPISDPHVNGTVLESYRLLSKGLLRALFILGVQANADSIYPDLQKTTAGPVCFEVPSNYEITVDGRKVIGSAQSRHGQGLLQHGSLPLFGNITRITDALVFETEPARRLAAEKVQKRATTLNTILGYDVPLARIEDAFSEGFSFELAIDFKEDEPSSEECSLANRLLKEKFNSDSWNRRV